MSNLTKAYITIATIINWEKKKIHNKNAEYNSSIETPCLCSRAMNYVRMMMYLNLKRRRCCVVVPFLFETSIFPSFQFIHSSIHLLRSVHFPCSWQEKKNYQKKEQQDEDDEATAGIYIVMWREKYCLRSA